MRKIIVISRISLDGVMESPNGPEGDSDFRFGGWTLPYSDAFLSEFWNREIDHPFDLLLGRKTYDHFAGYWPHADRKKNPFALPFHNAVKYVVTHRPVDTNWEKTVRITGDVASEIRKIKTEDGPELQVYGSANMIQTLLSNDLVDELWLKIYPLTLGPGKQLFGDGSRAAAFELLESSTSPKGVIVANYRRAGEIKTGSFE